MYSPFISLILALVYLDFALLVNAALYVSLEPWNAIYEY